MSSAGEPAKMLAQFQENLSHQEMSRIIEELEQLCLTIKNTNGPEQFVTATSAVTFLSQDLGYEDTDGFEAALGASFEDFVKCMPFLEHKNDDGPDDEKQLVFRLKPRPLTPRHTKKSFKITKSEDLWRVCMKTVTGWIEIPEIEFEIGLDDKRNIDAIYNHLAQAKFNLQQHARSSGTGMADDHKAAILETCAQLHGLLDIDEPWTFVLHDSEGTSEIHPDHDVLVEYPDEARGGEA